MLNRKSRELSAKEPGYGYLDYNIALYLKPNSDNTAGTRILFIIFLIDWLYSLVFVIFQALTLYYLINGEFDHREI